jgi:hypothetical protein
VLHLDTPSASFVEVFAVDMQNLLLKTGSVQLMS